MRLNLSLSVKLAAVVAIPLIINICFLIYLSNLQSRTEAVAAEAVRSRSITDAINTISKCIYDVSSELHGSKLTADFVSSRNLDLVERDLKSSYDELRKATEKEPTKYNLVKESEIAAIGALAVLKTLQSNPQIQTDLQLESRRKGLNKRLRNYAKSVLSDQLMELNRSEKINLQRSPEIESQLRDLQKSIFYAFAATNAIVTAIVAWLLIRGISSRLQTMSDNAYRLASDMPLNPVLVGTDEIARLDQTFHKMSQAISEAEKKQRAITDNARDVICSIDANGKFVAVNPASISVLQYSPAELMGRYYVDLICSDDVAHTLSSMEAALKHKDSKPFDTRMIKKDKQAVDTLWTAVWSEEEKSYFCVIHDDTARKMAERMKQEVVAMITHDLRTPLSTIRNFLEMLDADMYGDLSEKGKKMLALADRNSARMLGLINDLLDVEKIKAGMMELTVTNTKLSAMLEHCAQSVSPLAEANRIKVNVEAHDLIVKADEDRLTRVVTNLLSNAIKFSPADSKITLTASKIDGYAEVKVKDEGRGIPQEMIATIFDQFTQVMDSDSRAKGGSGLGLAICKALVELHGGTISVDSPEGQGTTFTFTVPLAS
ncbi:MAG: PAS domain S-box protein [Cyanobacteria bacterium SZAS-4]|nr:PAS domain S-box protein [Cyanobacteria bacterium SZAS-4]